MPAIFSLVSLAPPKKTRPDRITDNRRIASHVPYVMGATSLTNINDSTYSA
jgi:hypothetical protein